MHDFALYWGRFEENSIFLNLIKNWVLRFFMRVTDLDTSKRIKLVQSN